MIKEHPLVKGSVGIASASVSYIGDHASSIDPIIRGIMFYGGAIVVVFTAISFALDIRHKWKFRNHPDTRDWGNE